MFRCLEWWLRWDPPERVADPPSSGIVAFRGVHGDGKMPRQSKPFVLRLGWPNPEESEMPVGIDVP